MHTVYYTQKDDIELFTFPTGPLQTNSTFIIHNPSKDLIIIDSGHEAELSESIIEKKGLNLKKVIYTHTHFDHAAANKQLQDKFGGTIEIHKNEEELYNNLPESALSFGLQFPKPNQITRFIEDGELVAFDGIPHFFLKTIPTPGHTPGGVCFFTEYFDTPLVVAGDTLFNGSIGRTDLPGGDHQQLISSINNNLMSLPEETVVVCGHGPTTTIGKEKRTNPFLN